VRLEVNERLADVSPQKWNALVGEGCAFLEWEWLSSLEESGCVGSRTGWLPQHLTLWEGDELVGACPLYVKGHSMGEFVFDHGWAEAAESSGISYFPKLLVAVPFTPATGARFLSRGAAERPAVIRALGEGLKEICRHNGFSSAHVNFCLPDEVETLGGVGFVHREGYQYQWTNPGWASFEEYIAALKTKRRTQVRRERRELDVQGIEVETLCGDEIPEALFPVMFRLYRSTIDKLYWGRQYLNRRLFDLLREKPPVRFRRCEVGRAFVGGTSCVSLAKPTQRCATGCMHQVIVVEVRCDCVERRKSSAGTLGHADGNCPIKCDHGSGHEREKMIVESDDLVPVGCVERVGVAMDRLDRGLELEGAWLVAANAGPHDCMSLFDHCSVPLGPVLIAEEHEGPLGSAGRHPRLAQQHQC